MERYLLAIDVIRTALSRRENKIPLFVSQLAKQI
jgi:hypothetical protein